MSLSLSVFATNLSSPDMYSCPSMFISSSENRATYRLATALQLLKQNTSRKLNHRRGPVLAAPLLPLNVWSEEKRFEKLRYMHRNPVRRGLVAKPEDWPWSSISPLRDGICGTVEIESEWTARRREKQTGLVGTPLIICPPPFASPPHHANTRASGGPGSLRMGTPRSRGVRKNE